MNWYKQVVAGKPWTGNVSSEPEAGYIVISAGNATSTTASHLLVDIKGPEKADRTPGLDVKGNPIVLSPDFTLISLTVY